MNELIDFQRIWNFCVERWRNSFGFVMLIAVAFLFGMAFQGKLIGDDCKVMGGFRDGNTSYNCSVRPRNL